MKIEMLSKGDKDKIVFKLKDCSTTFANMIRREIIENVPVMAIETVEFRDNDSILYDEILAHRLGLIPLSTDLKSYTLPSKCKCGGEGCARCQVKLTIDVKGAGIVHSSDIKSTDPQIKPVVDKIPIVKLLKGQKLRAELTAVLGEGKDHMKFSPGLPYYHINYDFKQNKKIDNPEEVLENCPSGIFKVEKDKIVPIDETKSHMWDSILNFVPKDTITITPKEDEIIFSFESWGQLSPKEVITNACDTFSEQLNEFEKLFK